MFRIAVSQSSSAFFSLDALLSISIAIFMFYSFAALLSSASSLAEAQSHQASDEALAVSFNSYLLEKAAEQSGSLVPSPHLKANEIDLERLGGINLGEALAISGKNFASVRVKNSGGELFSSFAGEKTGQVFCARRLALVSGKPAIMEACLS